LIQLCEEGVEAIIQFKTGKSGGSKATPFGGVSVEKGRVAYFCEVNLAEGAPRGVGLQIFEHIACRIF
jgi:hypothetical protein